MEALFIFAVTVFISLGVTQEIVIPAGEYVIEKGSEIGRASCRERV